MSGLVFIEKDLERVDYSELNGPLIDKLVFDIKFLNKFKNLMSKSKGYDETPFQLAIAMQDIRFMNIIFKFGLKNGVDAVKLLACIRRPNLYFLK
jgi:hypothetical protein